MSVGNGSIESMEQRLQRLEEARVDHATLLAEQTTTLTALNKNFEELCTDLKAHNLKMGKFLDKLEEKLLSNSTRLDVIESGNKERSKVTAWKRRLLSSLIIALVSGVGTLIADRFLGK